MSNPRRLFFVSLSVGCCLALACRTQAQQRENQPTGEIKPAQTDSPGAHPVTDPPGSTVVPEGRRNADPRRAETGRARSETVRTPDHRDRADREGNLDRQLADCLMQKNKGEVELGKYAKGHAKHSDVKEFAEQMVKDHSEAVDKLQQIVGSQEPNDQRSKIAREVDEQCLASLKKELADKSDKEFDACYIGSQIAGHMQMAAALKVMSNHASGELADAIKQMRPTVDKHLSHAKKIMDELEKSRDDSEASTKRESRSR